MNPRVIAIGEALVEIMRPSPGQSLDNTGEFVGPFASGAPAIMIVASARLGNEVGFIGGIGDDAFGRLLLDRFDEEGVDSRLIQTPEGYNTGVAFVAYGLDGSREFVFHLRYAAAGALRPEMLDPAYFSNIEWLHISGSTLALSSACRETCQQALKYTRDNGGRFSFDPNLREELLSIEPSRRIFDSYIAAADVLLPTAEEAHALTGKNDDDQAAQAFISETKKILVLKRGVQGCSIYFGDKRFDIDGFEVEEIDPTGAGDCFNAAFLTGLDHDWPLEEVGRFANAAGALAVTRKDPMGGAPTREDIDELLAST